MLATILSAVLGVVDNFPDWMLVETEKGGQVLKSEYTLALMALSGGGTLATKPVLRVLATLRATMKAGKKVLEEIDDVIDAVEDGLEEIEKIWKEDDFDDIGFDDEDDEDEESDY